MNVRDRGVGLYTDIYECKGQGSGPHHAVCRLSPVRPGIGGSTLASTGVPPCRHTGLTHTCILS